MKARTSLWASLAVAASVGLAGCGGSSDNDDDMPPKPEPVGLESGHGLTDGEPFTIKAGESFETTTGAMLTCPGETDCTVTVVKVADGSYTATSTGGKVDYEAPPVMESVYEMAKADIEAAETRAAAQDILDRVKDDVTGTEADMLQTAVDMRGDAVEKAMRADGQKQELMRLAGLIDTSDLDGDQAKVDAAKKAIAKLQDALDNMTPDVDAADKSEYTSQLKQANQAVTDAQGGIDTATRRTTQMSELEAASTALQNALNAFAGKTATMPQLTAAKNAHTALKSKIDAGLDLTATEKGPYERVYNDAQGQITTAETAYKTAETERINKERMAAVAMAKDLYDAIKDRKPGSALNFGTAVTSGNTLTDVGNEVLDAGYGDGTSDDMDQSKILVAIGTDSSTNPEIFVLSEDKDASVDPIGDWTGKKYHRNAGNGGDRAHEATVYSYVGKTVQGNKFGSKQASIPKGYQYKLDTNGRLTAEEADGAAGADVFDPTKVELTGVRRGSGTETFKKEDEDDTVIKVMGSYHGVAGTYRCTPGGDGCTAEALGEGGLMLDKGTWEFHPSDASARVSNTPDSAYASFGWWMQKEGDDVSIVSAFDDYRGPPKAIDSTKFMTLRGTATYEGGAAGKYAIKSDTSGTHESGHFIAAATLKADFGTASANGDISGTIDGFKVGDDGESKEGWKVALEKASFAAADEDKDAVALTGSPTAVWTMSEGVAAPSGSDGSWSVHLRNDAEDDGDGGVPEIATGTFYSSFGADGRIVGGFGATLMQKAR